MLTPRRITATLGLVVVLCVGLPLWAQEEHIRDTAEQAEAQSEGKRKGQWVPAPIPIVNPTLGNGLGAVLMYMYQLDEESRVSYTGGGGMYTDTNSWGAGVAQEANFAKDKWRVKGGALYFDVNVNFYGIGNEDGDRGFSIPLQQNGAAFGARALRRVRGPWYAGLKYTYMGVKSTFDLTGVPPDFPVELPPEIARDTVVASLGAIVERDTRDNQFNAFEGSLFDFIWSVADEAVGSDFDYQSIKSSFNWFKQARERQIFAAQAYGCATPGDTPFYALCKFGQDQVLRGYVGGRYRDKTMLAAQLEYRWRFYKRFGGVVFGGVGQVGASLGDYNSDALLPSWGVGLRFMLTERNRLNLSVDYATGVDSSYWYFYVGESF